MKKATPIYSTSPEGSLWEPEHAIVAKLVSYLQPKKIFEFGTYEGETTNNLAANASDDALVYTFDLPQDALPKRQLLPVDKHFVLDKRVGCKLNDAYKKKIFQIFCDLNEYNFTDHYGTVDFLLVDSGHDRESVKRDTENALKLISSGVIVWHDYSSEWPEVRDYINENFLGKPGFCVFSGTRLAAYFV